MADYDVLGGLLGTVIVGGIAMRMADNLFGNSRYQQPRRRYYSNKRKTGTSRRRTTYYGGFGNFENILW